VADVDADGRDEVLLADVGQVVIVDLAEGAGIGSWDLRAARHPVVAVLRRRPEAYHEMLRELEAAAAQAGDAPENGEVRRRPEPSEVPAGEEVRRRPEPSEAPAAGAVRDPGAPATIHAILAAKERHLASRLHYDDHERRLGLIRLLHPDASPAEVAAGQAEELGDVVAGAFEVVEVSPGRLVVERKASARAGGDARPVRIEKSIQLGGDRRSPTLSIQLAVENRSAVPFDARIGLELPAMLLGGGGNPAAWIEVSGRRSGHDSSGTAAGVATLSQGNDHLGVAIDASMEPPADAWWAPIETISNSESGFERVYQGCGLLLSWPRRLDPGERFHAILRLDAAIDRDLAEDEA
jgi:alpha-amylase